jgi:hypothetical protein
MCVILTKKLQVIDAINITVELNLLVLMILPMFQDVYRPGLGSKLVHVLLSLGPITTCALRNVLPRVQVVFCVHIAHCIVMSCNDLCGEWYTKELRGHCNSGV